MEVIQRGGKRHIQKVAVWYQGIIETEKSKKKTTGKQTTHTCTNKGRKCSVTCCSKLILLYATECGSIGLSSVEEAAVIMCVASSDLSVSYYICLSAASSSLLL